VQIANLTIQPLLALYVNQLTDSANVASLAGLAFSAVGFGNLIATRQWGKLGDRIGHIKVIMGLLVISGLILIPQALVTSLWQLIVLRFLFGVASGGIVPCMTAYIRQVAPYEIQGELQGYNTSFRFLGNVIGPSIGGIIAGFIGISSVFYVTSALVILSFILLSYQVRKEEKEHKKIKASDPHVIN
ncbi:MAG: MFS transporter, partial [Caldibacillus sp.]